MNTNTAKALTNADIIAFPNTGLTDRQIDNRIKKLSDLESEAKRLKKEIESLKDEIKEAMHGKEVIETGRYIIRNTVVISNRFDSTAFKKEFPDVYREFTKETTSTRFTYKEA